jgi:arylsulfatase A-like enzyme
MTTITTGRYPTRHGILNHASNISEHEQRQVSGSKNLPERLPDNIYTFAIDKLERWHARGFDEYTYPNPGKTESKTKDVLRSLKDALPGPMRNGVEQTYEIVAEDISETHISHADATAVTDKTIQEIQSTNDGWFGLVHYWDVHLPYEIPATEATTPVKDTRDLNDILEPIKGSKWYDQLTEELLDGAETVGELKRSYDRAVRFVDQEIGRLISVLESEGIAEDTAIIVTADHGESFTEHGIVFDHHGLYDVSLHVPLVIDAPEVAVGESDFIQHFDLTPTILDLLGVNYEAQSFDGSSLVSDDQPIASRDAIFAEEAHTSRQRTIRTNQRKYIGLLEGDSQCRYCGISHGAPEELYDLSADPEETTNIIQENEDAANRLRERLDKWINTIPEPEANAKDFEDNEAAVERLEAMGYI